MLSLKFVSFLYLGTCKSARSHQEKEHAVVKYQKFSLVLLSNVS